MQLRRKDHHGRTAIACALAAIGGVPRGDGVRRHG